MFLVDVIKPKVENKLKTLSTFWATGTAQNKNNFVSFRFRSAGGNKNFIQKKREKMFAV